MPLTAHKGLVSLAFQAHFEVIDTNFNVQLFGSDSHRERDGRIHLFQSLVPNVLVSLASIAGVRLLFQTFFLIVVFILFALFLFKSAFFLSLGLFFG